MPESLPHNPNMPQPQPAVAPEALPPQPEQSKVAGFKDSLQIVYHGMAEAIANKRARRAGEVMEKMERKDAFYTDTQQLIDADTESIGYHNTVGRGSKNAIDPTSAAKTRDGETITPSMLMGRDNERVHAKGAFERLIDRRTDRLAAKRADNEVYAYRTAKIYGQKAEFRPVGVDMGVPDLPTAEELARMTPEERDKAHRIREMAIEEAREMIAERNRQKAAAGKYTIDPNTMPGITDKQRRKEMYEVHKQDRAGKLSAKEAREARTNIKAKKIKYGHREYVQNQKALNKSDRKLNGITEVVVNSPLREERHTNAIGRAQKQHEKAEGHRIKASNIQYERLTRSSDTDLADAYGKAVSEFRAVQHPDIKTEAKAAYTARAYAERLEQHATVAAEQHQAKFDAATQAANTYNTALAQRDALIAQAVAEAAQPGASPKTNEEIAQDIYNYLSDLYQKWVTADREQQRAYDLQQQARTNTNRVRYTQGYFATTRVRDEAEGERGQRKAMLDGNRVFWRTTLNGKQGDWLIKPDGAASLYHRNGRVDHYSSAGEFLRSTQR